MDAIAKRYVTALDELNILMAASCFLAEGDDEERARQVVNDLHSALIRAYRLGIQNASEMLGAELAADLREMEAAIFAAVGDKTFEERAAEHIRNDRRGRLRTLAETEFHRVYNRAVDDGARAYARREGRGVTKTWYTMQDDKVRDTHDYLEGMTVPVGQDFYTYDGDHAAYPGGFEKAANNANCRCIVKLNRNVP